MDKQIAKKETKEISFFGTGRSFDEIMKVCQMLAKSNAVPKEYAGRPEAIFLAAEYGAELGLKFMQSMQNIMIVNNRPAIWGDAIPGLVYNARVPVEKDGVQMGTVSLCEEFDEDSPAKALNQGFGRCKVKRYGRPAIERTFSIDEAKRAGLWNKTGSWQTYPGRMLQVRARGFACRDAFPDVLKGLPLVEEVYVEEKYEPTPMPESTEAPQVAQKSVLVEGGVAYPPEAPNIDPEPTSSGPEESDGQEPGSSPNDPINMETREYLFSLIAKHKVPMDTFRKNLLSQWNIKGTAEIPYRLIPEIEKWIKSFNR